MDPEQAKRAAEQELAETLDTEEITKEEVIDTFKQQSALTDGQINEIADVASSFLRTVVQCFGEEDVQINEYEGENDDLILDVSGGDLAVLIGRHGTTLDALQRLLNTYIRAKFHFYFPVHIDIEGYKERRADTVINIAERMADKAIKLDKDIHLKPMSSYERRIVHVTLLENAQVKTASEGIGLERHVVIKPKRH